MAPELIAQKFDAVLANVAEQARVADDFIDKNLYRILIATLWANVVLDPEDVGLAEQDLEHLHAYLNEEIQPVLGFDASVTECYRFVTSKPGEAAMNEARLSKTHRELLTYFGSMILDPEGHKRWMDEVTKKTSS